MFKTTLTAPHRIDIELDGKIEKEEMRSILTELLAKTGHIENGLMLYRIKNLKFPSIGALAVEFSMIPQLFKIIPKFKRAAVLADQEWVRRVSELEGKLFPGLEIKAWESHEEDKAEAWLTSP
ncbi:hypothetical protein NT6N_14520 [Oceaniferula spumae]|uniref:STAS/SEC14 domain-containing protein n=1 Tax=Oceaniferula spumae TaxID=2979115 RepID=A0AAT9FK17_9BACT